MIPCHYLAFNQNSHKKLAMEKQKYSIKRGLGRGKDEVYHGGKSIN